MQWVTGVVSSRLVTFADLGIGGSILCKELKKWDLRVLRVSMIHLAVGRIHTWAFMNSFLKVGVPLNDYQLLGCQKRFIS